MCGQRPHCHQSWRLFIYGFHAVLDASFINVFHDVYRKAAVGKLDHAGAMITPGYLWNNLFLSGMAFQVRTRDTQTCPGGNENWPPFVHLMAPSYFFTVQLLQDEYEHAEPIMNFPRSVYRLMLIPSACETIQQSTYMRSSSW
jgi:hypothetical protein